jgi:LytR_cpsA_psr family
MWAEVNLGGFINLVDSVGGVTINVTDGFCDPGYHEYGINGFGVSPGRYFMNGAQALAYARVRKAAGESDFTRAARQQEVIAALRDRLVRGAFLTDPGRFLRSLGQTIRTNIKPSFIADYIDIAAGIGRSDVFRVVIGHPLVKAGYDSRGSIQIPDVPAIRAMAARLFPPTGTRPVGFATMPSAGSGATRNASSSTTCGITPTPHPTRAPTPSPSPAASTATPSASSATPSPSSATPTPSSSSSAAPTPKGTPVATATPTIAPTPTASPTPTAAAGSGASPASP